MRTPHERRPVGPTVPTRPDAAPRQAWEFPTDVARASRPRDAQRAAERERGAPAEPGATMRDERPGETRAPASARRRDVPARDRDRDGGRGTNASEAQAERRIPSRASLGRRRPFHAASRRVPWFARPTPRRERRLWDRPSRSGGARPPIARDPRGRGRRGSRWKSGARTYRRRPASAPASLRNDYKQVPEPRRLHLLPARSSSPESERRRSKRAAERLILTVGGRVARVEQNRASNLRE